MENKTTIEILQMDLIKIKDDMEILSSELENFYQLNFGDRYEIMNKVNNKKYLNKDCCTERSKSLAYEVFDENVMDANFKDFKFHNYRMRHKEVSMYFKFNSKNKKISIIYDNYIEKVNETKLKIEKYERLTNYSIDNLIQEHIKTNKTNDFWENIRFVKEIQSRSKEISNPFIKYKYEHKFKNWYDNKRYSSERMLSISDTLKECQEQLKLEEERKVENETVYNESKKIAEKYIPLFIDNGFEIDAMNMKKNNIF